MNKRRQKTKRKIIDTLIFLLKNKPYDEIKIDHLVKEAGISRGAFYYNYKNLDEVLYDAFTTAALEIFGDKYSKEEYIYSSECLWDSIRFYDKYTELLLVIHQWNLVDYLCGLSQKGIIQNFKNHTDVMISKYPKYYTYFAYWHYYELCLIWIKSGKQESAEEFYKICLYFFEKRKKFQNENGWKNY